MLWLFFGFHIENTQKQKQPGVLCGLSMLLQMHSWLLALLLFFERHNGSRHSLPLRPLRCTFPIISAFLDWANCRLYGNNTFVPSRGPLAFVFKTFEGCMVVPCQEQYICSIYVNWLGDSPPSRWQSCLGCSPAQWSWSSVKTPQTKRGVLLVKCFCLQEP